jgi:hypothetical protein
LETIWLAKLWLFHGVCWLFCWACLIYQAEQKWILVDHHLVPRGVLIPKATEGQQKWLYPNVHLRETLNIFMALTILISSLEGRFSVNRFGSNLLEHTFRSVEIRRRDGNTMRAMINIFTRDFDTAEFQPEWTGFHSTELSSERDSC